MGIAHRVLSWLIAAVFMVGTAVYAEDAGDLGSARLFTNDYLGDGQDRWRSGNYHLSYLWGPLAAQGRPDQPGVLLDYRLNVQVIAPGRGFERPFAGIVAVGLHTHWQHAETELSFGADAVIFGPQTGLADFQSDFHDRFDLPPPRQFDVQIGNATYVGATAEAAWSRVLPGGAVFRPFVEAQVGPEQMLRGGFDLVLGSAQGDTLNVREPVTGHLLRLTPSAFDGIVFVAGADVARVWESAYLPGDLGFRHEDLRVRTRIGVLAQSGPHMSIFYGLTRLSPEGVGQSSGQTVGSMTLNINF